MLNKIMKIILFFIFFFASSLFTSKIFAKVQIVSPSVWGSYPNFSTTNFGPANANEGFIIDNVYADGGGEIYPHFADPDISNIIKIEYCFHGYKNPQGEGDDIFWWVRDMGFMEVGTSDDDYCQDFTNLITFPNNYITENQSNLKIDGFFLRITTSEPTPTPTNKPTPTRTPTPTPTSIPIPTNTPTLIPTATSTPEPTSSSTIATSTNISTPVCSDAKPGSAPVLYLATSSGPNSITLNWNKAKEPVTYYLVTFGTKSGEQLYGNPNVGNSNTTSYTINNLSGGKNYYFKVRAGNGCMPGDFSNEVIGRLTGSNITGIPENFSANVLGVTIEPSKKTLQKSNSKKNPGFIQILFKKIIYCLNFPFAFLHRFIFK